MNVLEAKDGRKQTSVVSTQTYEATVPTYAMTREHHIQFSVSAQLHIEE
jgi:hypothetical protein